MHSGINALGSGDMFKSDKLELKYLTIMTIVTSEVKRRKFEGNFEVWEWQCHAV